MKKKFSILLIGLIFLLVSLLFARNDEMIQVKKVISPTDIVLDKKELLLDDMDCFDIAFTAKNKSLAKKNDISEAEAFILGNLGKYWAAGLLEDRFVYLTNNDLVYLKFSYKDKYKYSGFCIKNEQPCYKDGFDKKLKEIRSTKYKVMDLDSDKIFEVNSPEVRNLKRYLVIKNFHLPRHSLIHQKSYKTEAYKPAPTISDGKIKIYLTDSTVKLKPERNCESSICREILNNINNSKKTIDMAIYGYSRIPEIENALIKAEKRGVKIRLVVDADSNGNNIYPDTDIIKRIIPDYISDINTTEAKNIMHNKFYIFDNRILITGSANLSHTDMSGFNSNSAIVIESEDVAKIYKKEFDQMFSGKFHNDKVTDYAKSVNMSGTEIKIYFSPQDKSISNGAIPIIDNAKEYIYIPAFVLTDKKITAALIAAKKRGVDVKIIIDALNASIQHSKHKELRNGGVQVKTENYAGKMHSKSIIIDDEYTIIGSMNFSYSGENKNDENMIVVKNCNIAKIYKEFFLYQWNKIDDKWLKYNARAEGKDSIGSCSDGLDNNYDGLTDMEDPACR